MSWLSRTDWHLQSQPKPTGQDLDNLGLDIRTWGGNVDAANNELVNLASARFCVAALPASPVEGMVAYDSATHTLKYRNASAWVEAGGAKQTPWAQAIDAAGYDLTNLGNLSLAPGKIISAPGQFRCRAEASSPQSVNDSVWTAIALGAESFDVGGMHDNVVNNSRITIPAGGDGGYLIIGRTMWTANATGVRLAEIRKNGVTYLGGSPPQPGHATLPGVASTMIFAPLVAGDYVELMGYQTSGGALNTYAATPSLLIVVKIC